MYKLLSCPPHAVVPTFDDSQDQREQVMLAMKMSIEMYKRDPEGVLEQLKQQMRIIKGQMPSDGGLLDQLKQSYEAGEIDPNEYHRAVDSLNQIESFHGNDNGHGSTLFLIELGVEEEFAHRMAQHPDFEAVLHVANLDYFSRHEEFITEVMPQLMQGGHHNHPLLQDNFDVKMKEELIAFLKRHLGD